VKAEQQDLESIATPLTAEEAEKRPAREPAPRPRRAHTSPGMPVSAPLAPVGFDREIAAIERVLEERGPTVGTISRVPSAPTSGVRGGSRRRCAPRCDRARPGACRERCTGPRAAEHRHAGERQLRWVGRWGSQSRGRSPLSKSPTRTVQLRCRTTTPRQDGSPEAAQKPVPEPIQSPGLGGSDRDVRAIAGPDRRIRCGNPQRNWSAPVRTARTSLASQVPHTTSPPSAVDVRCRRHGWRS
jgi:hypothetical protein